MHNPVRKPLWFSLLLGLVVMTGTGQGSASTAVARATVQDQQQTAAADGVIARVGDQSITFGLLNTMLNSSAMVGLSIPSLGSTQRRQVMITLLDKAISANLLYLDAIQRGVDRQVDYQRDIRQFEDAILASLYKSKNLLGDIRVSDAEIAAYYRTSVEPGTELTDDVKTAIAAVLRKQKLQQHKATLRQQIREGVSVDIEATVLDPNHDDTRKDSDTVATIHADNFTRSISWGEVTGLMQGADRRVDLAAFYLDNDVERRKRLDSVIDTLIMAERGRQAGLEKDASYLERTGEYRKTHMINLHRSALIREWMPTDTELEAWFDTHRDRIMVPEMRKLQMVVLKTREEAESVKQKIDSGEITIFQAARDYSIDPNAQATLGEMGWVARDTGFKDLDDFTFLLEPEVLGGPVESPAGWHLVKVLDVQDAQRQYFQDPGARRTTLRLYMHEQLNNYVVALRKESFKVSVNEAELDRQFQREAVFIARLSEQAAQEGSLTQQRQEDLKRWMQ